MRNYNENCVILPVDLWWENREIIGWKNHHELGQLSLYFVRLIYLWLHYPSLEFCTWAR